MKARVKESENMQEVTATEKQCRFGKTVLPILEENDRRGFKPLEGLPLDLQQRCLLDGIWRASSRKKTLDACCALQYYFSKIMEPPQGRNFSYYVLYNGPKAGIYCYYSSLVKAMEKVESPHYKGFYSFSEALNNIWDNVHNKNATIYIEEEPRHGPFVESYATEVRDLRAQINELITEITELRKPRSDSQEMEEDVNPKHHRRN